MVNNRYKSPPCWVLDRLQNTFSKAFPQIYKYSRRAHSYRGRYCGFLCSCETWLVRVVDERALSVFENDSICQILHVMELPRRLCLTDTARAKKTVRWFGHAARRLDDELIKEVLLPTWRLRRCGQSRSRQSWSPRDFGCARRRKDRVNVSTELTQDRRAWGASLRDAVNSIGGVGSNKYCGLGYALFSV